MWRFDRLEPEDSLLEDDDEWLDDAIAIVSTQVGFFFVCFRFFLSFFLVSRQQYRVVFAFANIHFYANNIWSMAAFCFLI